MNLFIANIRRRHGRPGNRRVPYGRYLRWVWPLLLAILAAVTVALLGVGAVVEG
jgi:hypothetical protein